MRGIIARELGRRYGLRILSLRELIGWFTEQARRAFNGLHVLAALVLVVAFVGVGDALSAGMLERTRELGVARATGLRRRVVSRMVLLEALVLGLLGLVLTWVLGLVLGVLWVKATFPALLGWTLVLDIPFAQVGVIGAAAVAVCLLGAYLPARRAMRLHPAAALRAE